MKVYLVRVFILSVCLVCVLSKDRVEELHKLTDVCLKEKNVTMEEFTKVKGLQTKPEDVKGDVKCVTHCILFKAKLLLKGGKFNEEEFRKAIASHVTPYANQVLADCNKLNGTDPCDTTFQISVCLWKHRANSAEA